MLTATIRYWTDELGQPTIVGYDNQALHLQDLQVHVTRLAERPSLTAHDTEISGHRAWLTVNDPGYIFHAYFGEDGIDFEWHHQTVGRAEVLAGALHLPELHEVLRLLDSGQAPEGFLRNFSRHG